MKTNLIILFTLALILSCSKNADEETSCWTFTYTIDCTEDLLDETYETTQCNLTESLAEEVRKSSESETTYDGVNCTIKVTKRRN